MVLQKFSEIDPQAVVDEMCAEYRKVDALLSFPKNGFPGSRHWYTDCNCSPPVFHFMRFFRNIGALDKYESLIERFDPFFIAVEHFTGKIQISRTVEPALTKDFTDKFFAFILADAFRSALDIYAKFLGWFFDLKGKEKLGFSYEQFIIPLKSHASTLAEECNALQMSPHFRALKALRDAEKHEGLGKTLLKLNNTATSFELELKRPEPFDLADVERTACACLQSFRQLLQTTSGELSRWPLGYPSALDQVVEIDDEGFLRMPRIDSKSK